MFKNFKKIVTAGIFTLPFITVGLTSGIMYSVNNTQVKSSGYVPFEYNFDYLKPLSADEIEKIKTDAISFSVDATSINITPNANFVTISDGSVTENVEMDKILSYFSWKKNISHLKVRKFFGNPIIGNNYSNVNIGGASNFKNFLFGIKKRIDADPKFTYFGQQVSSLKDTITNKKQELGVYFTGPGTFPWTTFVKHAVLVDSDTTIFRINNKYTYPHQTEFNAQAFIDFKKSRGFTGTVIQRHAYQLGAFSKKILDYLDQNRSRRINLYINHGQIGVNILEEDFKIDLVDTIMTKYPNVWVHGIEDGVGMTRLMQSKGLTFWRNASPNYYSTHCSRVKEYSLIDDEINNFDSEVKIMNPSTDWMSNELFNKRHKEDGSYFSNWANIIGVNWQKINQDIHAINANGKPSLLILGSYWFQDEPQWVSDLFDKYKNQYNIFYKGHPGHNNDAERVHLKMNGGIDDFLKQKIHMLPISVASEELTNNHIADGLKFDKFAMTDWSGAIQDIPGNGYNTKHDLLEILVKVGGVETPMVAGTPQFDNFIQSFPMARLWWGKYVR